MSDTDTDTDTEFTLRACRVCGCTDDDCVACSVAQGEPCHWVDEDPEGGDLCSRCGNEILARELVATVASIEREPGASVPLTLVERRAGYSAVQADELAAVAGRLGLLDVLGRVVRRLDVPEPSPASEVTGGADSEGVTIEAGPESFTFSLAELGLPNPPTPTSLPVDQRAAGDGYWTPDKHALACTRWLAEHVPQLPVHFTAVEPAVGGGAWVRALRAVSQGTHVDRMDLDPKAPGLGGLRRGLESSFQGKSWLDGLPEHAFVKRRRWDLCIGNPPYGGDLVRWLDVSLDRADVVAYLLRETVTGAAERLDWWLAHRPAFVAKVLPRPRWQGPGQRDTSDYCDHVFVVWVRGVTDTRWDWIDCRETSDV